MKWLETRERSKLAVAGLVLGAVLFFAVNVFSNTAFQSARLDLTQGKLFTLSSGTMKVLRSIGEPVTVRLYFSALLGEASPQHTTYFERIRELLERYQDISGGKVRLEVLNPEPFSDAEDRAVAAGLQGIPLNNTGDLGYFGLSGFNSTDDRTAIPFFTPERETFLEYDLTRIIHTLSEPDRKVIGVMSSVPIHGGATQPPYNQAPKWSVLDQVGDFFEVRELPPAMREIPEEIDILMLVHPKGWDDFTFYAIDQFVLGGGRVLVFVDSNAEVDAPPDGRMRSLPVSNFDRILKTWGVKLVKDKIAGDLDAARRVNVRVSGKTAVVDYVVWLSLDKRNFDTADAVTGSLTSLVLASPGILEATGVEGITVQPLVSTGPKAMAIDSAKVMAQPDVVGLFRDFKAGEKPLMLAARVSGAVKTAFPDGPPKEKDGTKAAGVPPKHLAQSETPANLIVVSDVDMLHDRFWAEIRQLLGQKLLVPYANNADFVVSALDNLGGSDALIGLRGRANSTRPFGLVQEIRQGAERQFRTKERDLQTKLEAVRARLENLQRRRGGDKEVVLSADDKTAIEQARNEMVTIRKDLRGVQAALRQDIDRLESLLKFLNIGLIPLLLGFAAILAALIGRFRRKAQTLAASAADA